MNENEKRLFADVAAEDEEYMRVMASAKRSSIFMGVIWSVFAIVMGIMMKDLYMLLLILAMAALMAVSFFRTKALSQKKLVTIRSRSGSSRREQGMRYVSSLEIRARGKRSFLSTFLILSASRPRRTAWLCGRPILSCSDARS